MQPYFYMMQKWEKKIAQNLNRMKGMIGVDVADGDHITDYAVRLTEHATALIVPSEFSRRAYINSGVKKAVHVLPHGCDPEWIEAKKLEPSTFHHLAKLKETRNLKLILSWILHSPYRKGLDLLLEYYEALLKEYNDVLLVVKTGQGVGYFPETIENVGGQLEYHMEGKVMMGWLNEKEKQELYDLCDIYFLSSRGGGFEHPPLEALARGEIVLGAKGGAWEDYLPDWALIPSHRSGRVLENNPIHDGCGVELEIDKAVDKTIEILNNIDEYKEKVKEHIETKIKNQFTWPIIGEKLKDIVEKYI
jgi:glycosyltransferase involved in cell wall biosynthesis